MDDGTSWKRGEEVNTLREILREKDVSLYQALETSWETARNEWTPTLNMDSESHGGIPHLQNVETWIGKIAEACAPIWRKYSELPFGFNALEVYLVLAAALFHDIGRGRRKGDHGKASGEIINAHWAQLGIISQRIAIELARVCEFHTSEDKWGSSDVVVKIHPWGIVHTQAIASLLCLADELDTAYDRVVPQYMRAPGLSNAQSGEVALSTLESSEYLTKGLWRDMISDVDMDPGSRLIKTVIFPRKLPGHHDDAESAVGQCNKVFAKMDPRFEFRPEDYFYCYLEQLRDHVDSQVLDYLSERYQFSDQFERLGQLWKLSLPAGYPEDGSGDLRYLLHGAQYWARQVSTPLTPRTEAGRTSGGLEDAIKVVMQTMEGIDELLKRKSDEQKRRASGTDQSAGAQVQAVEVNVEPLKKLLNAWGWKQCLWRIRSYLYANEQSIENFTEKMTKLAEAQSADACIALLDENSAQAQELKEELEKLGKDAERIRELHGDPLKPIEAHKVLIRVFRYMLDIDLVQLGKSGTIEPRKWVSFSIPEFHTNLLLAFGVYLANAQRLWRIEEDLPFLYVGRGQVEIVGDELGKLLDQFSSLTKDPKIYPSEKSYTEEDLKKKLRGELNDFNKARRDTNSVQWDELEYAVRWMFMRWLMKDVSKKNKQLTRIKPGLQKLEIPFDGWFIEYDSHLFTEDWIFCLEPNLNRQFMDELVEKLFSLKEAIHQQEESLPWDTLAAALREPTMERVRTATVRLASLLRVYRGLDCETPSEKQLHYGHLLQAELAEDKSSDGPAIETSLSAWKLKGTKPEKLADFLELVLDWNHEKNRGL